jgi:hypothetical protein
VVAHLGGEGWRECSNSFGDLQLRVYVSDSAPAAIARRISTRGLAAVRKVWSPIVQPVRDSAGWQIAEVIWTYDGGDYNELNTFEVFSRVLQGRTVSLVFMYARGIPSVELARRGILDSYLPRTTQLPPLPGLDSIVLSLGSCNGGYCKGFHATLTKSGDVRLYQQIGGAGGQVRTNTRTVHDSVFHRLEQVLRSDELYELPEEIDFGAKVYCPGPIKADTTLSLVFFGVTGIEKQIRDNHGCPEPARTGAAPGLAAPFDRLTRLRAFEREIATIARYREWLVPDSTRGDRKSR